ncbi:Dyp-type peroxidase [Corynebacterium breve]|uniref:Dyp-type peroxidase n=1 Tax=Corynebacterium breve TaxID=3049799 RepID=A0ABY8VIS1_9CORY|nr:Dyp-type peroxidase [Corynebacterium breve]WIM68962.1 Dyp-type peroxidase [Corynebacterium breve]
MSVSRRGFMAGATVAASAAALASCANAGDAQKVDAASDAETRLTAAIVDFDGPHQAGIETPVQANLNLISFNLKEDADRTTVTRLLRLWTEDARSLCAGKVPLGSLEPEMVTAPANLTITCGIGPRVFEVADLVDKQPDWLQPLPEFSLDQLDEKWGQSDFVLQICSDDPIMASHAMRHMVRAAMDYAETGWLQQGFLNADGAIEKGKTPRNLFGQVDGTVNPHNAEEYKEQVWIDQGADFLIGGTSMVVRRINMNLDTWEMLDRASREESIGRDLEKGAPLSGGEEFDQPDFSATDKYGLPLIDKNSHMARATAPEDAPEQKIKRRPYNYDVQPDPALGQLSNAGLVFITFQKDPVKQYVPIQQRLDESDRLNIWITHIGSAVYWVPPGVSVDGDGDHYWAESLFADDA